MVNPVAVTHFAAAAIVRKTRAVHAVCAKMHPPTFPPSAQSNVQSENDASAKTTTADAHPLSLRTSTAVLARVLATMDPPAYAEKQRMAILKLYACPFQDWVKHAVHPPA